MNFLSYGGGINSTALAIMLIQKDIPFVAIFADTGVEHPKTYQFIWECFTPYLESKKRKLIFLRSGKYPDMFTWMAEHRRIPLPIHRGCTTMWKLDPIKKYLFEESDGKPCTQFIGIDSGESHRANRSGLIGNCENRYPLVEWEVNRESCKLIIKKAGLSLPDRSNCWFCGFKKIGEWRDLYHNNPELYERAIWLENNQEKGFTFRKGNSLSKLARRFMQEDGQGRLFADEEELDKLMEQNLCTYCMT